MKATFQKEFLRLLRDGGSDPAKPHDFEFYLYLPTRALAAKAADTIRQSGSSAAKVSRAPSRGAWLCVAKKKLVPEKADLADHARFFEQIADALGGEFDGWEAEIV